MIQANAMVVLTSTNPMAFYQSRRRSIPPILSCLFDGIPSPTGAGAPTVPNAST